MENKQNHRPWSFRSATALSLSAAVICMSAAPSWALDSDLADESKTSDQTVGTDTNDQVLVNSLVDSVGGDAAQKEAISDLVGEDSAKEKSTANPKSEDASEEASAENSSPGKGKFSVKTDSTESASEEPGSTESDSVDSTDEVEQEFLSVDIADANIQIQKDAQSGGKLRLIGKGWTDKNGSGSTLTIKLNYLHDGETAQYKRGSEDTGNLSSEDIFPHPRSGEPEPTIFWQFDANPDGTFDREEILPLNLEPGQMLKLNVASGSRNSDVFRSSVSPSLRVEGLQWEEPLNTKPECKPSSVPPTATVATKPAADNTLHIEGKGFCNKFGGGARVALKFDTAKVKHVKKYKIHDNPTIWQIVEADDRTGDFTIDLKLPDGTNDGPYGTVKPFKEGEHIVNILAGSLQEGDIQVSLGKKNPRFAFVVGSYKPSAVPDPLNYDEDLLKGNQKGVAFERSGNDVVVTVDGGKEGDWVYVNTYIEDGSSRIPWSDKWFQLDKDGKATLPYTEDIPAGPLKVTVQNGNQGKFGQLIGWDFFQYQEKEAEETKEPESKDQETKQQDTKKKKKKKTSELAGISSELNSLRSELIKLGKITNGEKKGAAQKKASLNAGKKNSTAGSKKRVVRRVVRRSTGSNASNGGNTRFITRSNPRVVSGAAGGKKQTGLYDPKPAKKAKAPVKSVTQLTAANSHKVSGSVKGEELKIKIPKLKTGQWADLHIYTSDPKQEPVDAGWVQVGKNGQVRLDTSGLPDGEYMIAASDSKGNLVGWLDLALGETTSNSSPAEQMESESAETPNEQSVQEQSIAPAGMMTSTDWWLILASLLVPLGTAGVLGIFRRKL